MSTEKYPEHKKRTLLLSDQISQGSVKSIMDSILEINEDDSEKNSRITLHAKPSGIYLPAKQFH